MNKGQMNLQDVFLNQVRKEHVPVTIYLVGGVQLKGLIKGFDSFTVMLDSPGKPTQIVYKHAIASVVPSRQMSLAPQETGREEVPAREESPAREEAPAKEKVAAKEEVVEEENAGA